MSNDSDRTSVASNKDVNKDVDVEAATPPPEVAQEEKSKVEEEKDPNLVTWDGPEDPGNPQNFSNGHKVFITLIWVYGNLTTTIASSIWSSGASAIALEFDKSTIVVTLGVSLFLLVSLF